MICHASKIFGKRMIMCRFGVVKFNLPDLGEKIKEGTVKKIYVSEGQPVKLFEKIAEVASDKQFTEITATNEGTIRKIYYKEEQICQVGNVFMEIQTNDQHQPPQKTQQSSNSSSKPQQSKPIIKQQNYQAKQLLATPYVRGLIKKYKIDQRKLRGSGERGRVTEIDINQYINTSKPQTSNNKQNVNPITSQSNKPSNSQVTTVIMSNFEKGMQKSMSESRTIPHLYLHEQFDISQTQKMRKIIKNSSQKVTLMGILIKTFSLALRKYPKMNAIYEPTKKQFQYTINSQHNISIAIDSPNGLVVPNIKSVNTLNLSQIQSQLERLRKLSQQAKLTSKQLNHGTVCLSNIGTIAGTHACPLILPPQVCIVAIGKMQLLPKYLKGQNNLVGRNILNVSYGCDHRVIDGGTVAKFSNEWKKILENPYLALAQMS